MKNFILGFLSAAVLIGGGFYAYTRWSAHTPSSGGTKEAIKYHCPMHPTYISDRQGDCPICGMRLVPLVQDSGATSPPSGPHAGHEAEGARDQPSVPGYATVTVPQERIQMMGITLGSARRMDLDQNIRTYGLVTSDETKVYHVHTKFEGFIEELYVDYVGSFVRKGQPLFSIYSPELYATQNEYLLALRAEEQMLLPNRLGGEPTVGRVNLLSAARQRLGLWDVDDSQIRELERTRTPFRALTYYSPVSGYVTAKTALKGFRVMPGDNLYDIVDLSTVWVQADIYEVNLPFVRLGQPATLTLPYQPGKSWKGKVTYILPTVDPATRTVKARLEFANPTGELKPEMYGDVVIGGRRGTGIAIPESAVIATGERNIVFVAKGQGVFEPREVVVGVKVRDMYEIKEGIAEDEQVVTGANFLLDSESKLKAATSGVTEAHKH